VVQEPVRDAGLLRDVSHAAVVVAAAREHADCGVEEQPPFLLLCD
jgi:hypothetical protein